MDEYANLGSGSVNFGERLAKLRAEHGWRQADLGEQLGIHRSVVAHYESGRASPSIPVLKKLADVFQVSLDWLLLDDALSRDVIHDRELLEYFGKSDRLDRRERSQIKDFIDGVLARHELEELRRKPAKSKQAA